MGLFARISFLTALLILLVPACRAAGSDDATLTPAELAQLELRAQQASPRDQCFLYTQIVHALTETAGRQMLAGNEIQGRRTLLRIQHYAGLIRADLSRKDKRLVKAQMLMHHTTRRLQDYLHAAPFEDQDALAATLKQLNQLEDALLTQVFAN